MTAALLNRHQAAEYLTISVRTVDELMARGDLPAVKIGRSVRFRQSTLDAFIDTWESRKGSKRPYRRHQ